jgi:hypothetical protein
MVARLVEARLPSRGGAALVLAEARRLLKRSGVHVLLGYSAHPGVNARLQENGWRPRADAQPSFLCHAPRQARFEGLAFNGSASDFGFEAIGLP